MFIELRAMNFVILLGVTGCEIATKAEAQCNQLNIKERRKVAILGTLM